jgi:hypothetical protein
LRRGGQHFVDRDRGPDIVAPKPFQSRRGKQGRIGFSRRQLRQPRVDIAAE